MYVLNLVIVLTARTAASGTVPTSYLCQLLTSHELGGGLTITLKGGTRACAALKTPFSDHLWGNCRKQPTLSSLTLRLPLLKPLP